MIATDYAAFIAAKQQTVKPVGIPDPLPISDRLFPFQQDVVRWALKRGKAALFEDCGLGKSPQQLEWAHHVARHTQGDVLILAPLSVSQQTVREGVKFGIDVAYARNSDEVRGPITITNYERLDAFDASRFAGIVLDESSILKSFDGSTRTAIIDAFGRTPFRLACTATPAPNDFMELGNHSDFLGILTRAEMLAQYFVHDGGSTQDWRIKGHAEEVFWRWVCEWAVMLRRPSDLGYSDEGYTLPPLHMHEHVVAADHSTAHKGGLLFKMEALTLQEQRAARRASLDERVALVARLANASDEAWVIWCDLNDEGDAITAAIPSAVQVAGSDSPEEKEDRLVGFAEGRYRVLVTKTSIAGFGMNWQHARNMAMFGSHSFERFYQSVRREWRFGQTREVHCHVITSELEGRVIANLKRKEQDAARMADAMVGYMREIQQIEIRCTDRQLARYAGGIGARIPNWLTTQAEDLT